MIHRIHVAIMALILAVLLAGCSTPESAAILEATRLAESHADRREATAEAQPASSPDRQVEPADLAVAAPSKLTVKLPDSQPVGAPIVLDATLVNLEQEPLPNKVLIVTVNGERVRRIRTDDQGKAEINIGRDLPAGTHQVEVVSQGTAAYSASADFGEVTIKPAVLSIQTVPPVPGIGFILDGRSVRTDPNGTASFEIGTMGTYSLALAPLPNADTEAPMLIQFERWADGVFFPDRELEIKGDKELSVGLSISHRIDLNFVDLAGKTVDPSRTSEITLKSSHGTRFTYQDGRPRWLKANRVARLTNGLEATQIQYSVEAVIVDGTNVVNQNQQRFLVQRDETWPVELLLYSVHVQARDALFGFPIATGIELRYPDGQVKSFALDANSEVFVDSLARGDYKIRATGAAGIAPETPVSLSRDQDVELKVLSRFDISVALAAGVVIALGLLFYGRPQLILAPGSVAMRLFARRPRRAPHPLGRPAAMWDGNGEPGPIQTFERQS